jgi:hypothetical protein
MSASSADDIREKGWMVAVHNDYRLNGELQTFWLFTKGSRVIMGEGRTDAEALNIVRSQINNSSGRASANPVEQVQETRIDY